MEENRRVRMTKRLLKEAMLELLEQRPIERITVTDVCRSADVNRSTFYAYYADVAALMLEIENDVLGQLPVPSGVPASQDQFLPALEGFFDYVRGNERLFRLLVVQRDSSSFNRRLVNTVMENYRLPFQGEAGVWNRYAYVYCVNGVIGIIREWIDGGFPISTHDFARIVLQISVRATSMGNA